jgi:hypothetical protein
MVEILSTRQIVHQLQKMESLSKRESRSQTEEEKDPI